MEAWTPIHIVVELFYIVLYLLLSRELLHLLVDDATLHLLVEKATLQMRRASFYFYCLRLSLPLLELPYFLEE